MINSHYVPQFILRNFYADNKVSYCDLDNRSVQSRNARSIFSEEGYYPENIERDLCKKAEYQFANLFHNKLENARHNVALNADELFTLKKFLIVSAIRYKEELSEDDRKLVESLGPAYRTDYDRSLNQILACEKLEDVSDIMSPVLDYVNAALDGKDNSHYDVNLHLHAELNDILHSYIVFIRPRGDEKFLIPDIGRGYYDGPFGLGKMAILMDHLKKTGDQNILRLMQLIGVRDYSIYPLSPEFAVLTMNSFFKLLTESEFHYNVILPDDYPTVSSILGFGNKNIIAPPKVKMRGREKEYRYEISSLTSDDVCHLNRIMLAEAKRYIACAGLETIQRSIQNADEYTDRNLSFMKL